MIRPSLVGRHREVERLIELLARAQGGRGQLAVVRGDAGIGKTRLVAEVADEATARGMRVRMAEAVEFEQTRPFGAIADAFGVSASAIDPRLVALAGELAERPTARASLEETPVKVHYLIEQMVEVFESLCTSGDLLLAIENLHWMDGSTLALLQQLARLCRQYPALIIVTTRPTDRAEVEAFIGAALETDAAIVDLGPLDFDAVCALVAELAGARPGPRLAVQLERASGIPLYVIELIGTMIQQGAITLTSTVHAEVDEAAIPVGFEVTILERLSLLGAETVELPRKAAILGPTIDVAELGVLTRRPPVELAGSLREATRAGLIEADGERLAFSHDLVHDALYRDWTGRCRSVRYCTPRSGTPRR